NSAGSTGDTGGTLNTQPPGTTSTDDARITTILTLTGDPTAGEGTYARICAACHGPDGTGIANGAADLTQVLPTIALDEVVTTILEGRGNMDAYDQTLKNQEVADVAAYIETTFNPTR